MGSLPWGCRALSKAALTRKLEERNVGAWLRATGPGCGGKGVAVRGFGGVGTGGSGRGDEVKGCGWSHALGAPLAFPRAEDRRVLTANSRACSSTWGREGGSQGFPLK